MNPVNDRPFWLYAAAGATFETVVRQPLMAISSKSISAQCTTVKAIKKLYELGGIGKFYSGMQGFVMGLSQRGFHRVGTFAINEHMKESGRSLPAISATAAAFEVGCTMVGENFLTTAQTDTKSRTIFQIVQDRYRQHGMRAFTVGLPAAMGRNTVFNMFYFGPGYFLPNESRQYPILSAAAAGTGAVLSSHSFEILRVEKTVTPNKSYAAIISNLWKRCGLKALVQGVVPRLSSAGLGSAIALSVYQKLKQ